MDATGSETSSANDHNSDTTTSSPEHEDIRDFFVQGVDPSTTVLEVSSNALNQPYWTKRRITTLWKALEPHANVYLQEDRLSYAILHYATNPYYWKHL